MCIEIHLQRLTISTFDTHLSDQRHTSLTLQLLSAHAGSGVIDLTAEDDAQDAAAGSGPAAAPVTRRELLSKRLQREYMAEQPQTEQGTADDRDQEAGLDMEQF